MVARAANTEPRLASIPCLPFFERLAPPGPAEDYVAEIEAWTKPGEVVLDLNGRGGWVARAAIAEQRRAADFEAWPLTRLLADVVLRPPDLRQIDSAAMAIANAPFTGSTIKRAIDALYSSSCPRCGRPVILEAMIWHPHCRLPKRSGPGTAAATQAAKGKDQSRSKGSSAGSQCRRRRTCSDLSPAAAALMPYAFSPEESLQASGPRVSLRAMPRPESAAPSLRQADPTQGDLRLAETVPAERRGSRGNSPPLPVATANPPAGGSTHRPSHAAPDPRAQRHPEPHRQRGSRRVDHRCAAARLPARCHPGQPAQHRARPPGTAPHHERRPQAANGTRVARSQPVAGIRGRSQARQDFRRATRHRNASRRAGAAGSRPAGARERNRKCHRHRDDAGIVASSRHPRRSDGPQWLAVTSSTASGPGSIAPHAGAAGRFVSRHGVGLRRGGRVDAALRRSLRTGPEADRHGRGHRSGRFDRPVAGAGDPGPGPERPGGDHAR
jgi:hypothetical protein